jgi:hypothetical protein
LDGILYIRWKFRPVELAAVRTLFVLGMVFSDLDPELGIMDLSPLDFDRPYTFQRLATPFTDRYRVNIDVIGGFYPVQCMAFMPFLSAYRSFSLPSLTLRSPESVTRWGFATVLTVLIEPGFQFGYPRFKLYDPFCEFGYYPVLLFYERDYGFRIRSA